jgi:hypothetical protein
MKVSNQVEGPINYFYIEVIMETAITPNIQGVSGGIVNIVGGGSMDYSE